MLLTRTTRARPLFASAVLHPVRFQSTKPLNNNKNNGNMSNATAKKPQTQPQSQFNALSNKNILTPSAGRATAPPRVKKDYASTLPRVPHSTYLSPLHIKLDCLYAMHRPLQMEHLRDELLPLSNRLISKSWKDFPSTFHPKSEYPFHDHHKETSTNLRNGSKNPRSVTLVADIRDMSELSLFEPSPFEEYDDFEMESVDVTKQRGWQRTPFALSAVGTKDFNEWNGAEVGKLIKAMKGRIGPFEKPKDNRVINVNELEKAEKVETATKKRSSERSFYTVEQKGGSSPAQRRISRVKTKGRIKPRQIIMKKKKD